MSLKATISGEFTIVNESSNEKLLNLSLSSIFGNVSSIKEHVFVERQISSGDGAVSVHTGGIGTIKGFLLVVESGTVTVKHDSNSTGIDITSSALVLFGKLASITIETLSATDISVKYVLFG